MAWDVTTSIEIDAPADAVWDLVMDLDGYGRWNPLAPRMAGALEPGSVLEMTVRLGREIQERTAEVFEVGPGRRVVWSSAEGGGRIVRGVRTQTVDPIGPDRCRYTSAEVFTGPFVPVLKRFYGDTLLSGLEGMMAALKDEAEQRAGTADDAITIDLPPDVEARRLPHKASWYFAGEARHLKAGDVQQITLCGQDLVVWRTKAGRLGAARNVCGHMAAKLAPGAMVQGEALVCPHHHSRFDAKGAACDHGGRGLSSVPIREVGPLLMVWYHPDGAAPTFEVPAPDMTGWGKVSFQHLDLAVHPQHIMQDLADMAHFTTVHRYRDIAPVHRTRVEGAELSLEVDFGWDPGHPRLPSLPTWFRSKAYGLGYQLTDVKQLGGVAKSRHFVLPVPIDAHTTRVYLGMATRLPGVPLLPSRGVSRAVAERVFHKIGVAVFRRDVKRDASLWTQRVHCDDVVPALDVDGQAFETWVAQFDAGLTAAA